MFYEPAQRVGQCR